MSVIGVSSSYSSFFASSGAASWLGDTMTAIQNSQRSAGIMGALSASNDGSLNSFLGQSAMFADNLALIAQGSVTDSSSLVAQIAAANQEKAMQETIAKVAKDLLASQSMVKPENTLDAFIYFGDGSSLETATNILTMSDGTQYDITTGAKYIDPESVIQMGNGSYLDTKNNILTLADGTQIDTVTGLLVSTEA
jgi:hypothetical protein